MKMILRRLRRCIIYSSIGCTCHAQSSTITASAEQLAELLIYQHTTGQGYQIMNDGLDSIGAFTGAEYQLHQGYFTSLGVVKPAVLSSINFDNMNRVLVTMAVGLLALQQQAHSQSISDLLEQLLLDKEKLSSMKSTLQEMYNGYTTLEKGYTNIRDIAKGNFDLHQGFLDALWVASPAVRSDPRITMIINAQYNMITNYQQAGTVWSGAGVFTPQEVSLIVGTYGTLLQRCEQSIAELSMVITDDQLRMSDAQRLEVIARVNSDTQQQLAMTQQLNNTLSIQTAQRLQEQGDINSLKNMYGIPY